MKSGARLTAISALLLPWPLNALDIKFCFFASCVSSTAPCETASALTKPGARRLRGLEGTVSPLVNVLLLGSIRHCSWYLGCAAQAWSTVAEALVVLIVRSCIW